MLIPVHLVTPDGSRERGTLRNGGVGFGRRADLHRCGFGVGQPGGLGHLFGGFSTAHGFEVTADGTGSDTCETGARDHRRGGESGTSCPNETWGRGADTRDPRQHRNTGDPRHGTSGEPEPSEGHLEQCTCDVGVELGSRTALDLRTGLGRRHGLLVGTGTGDHIEGVGHRDDPPRQGDVLARQAVGIPGTVESFMVLHDRQHLVTEPVLQRSHQFGTRCRVGLDDLELVVGEPARLVEDLPRHLDLSDIVQERSPTQSFQGPAVEPHLLTYHLGIGADPLGVTAGEPVVGVQGRDEDQQALGGLRRSLTDHTVAGLLDHPPEVRGGAGDERYPEARRRPVREHERQPQQGSEGEQPARHAFEQPVGGHGKDEHRQPPADLEPAGGLGVPVRNEPHRRQGAHRRHQECSDAHDQRGPLPGSPAIPPERVGAVVGRCGEQRGCVGGRHLSSPVGLWPDTNSSPGRKRLCP